jgi:hypothetical protein
MLEPLLQPLEVAAEHRPRLLPSDVLLVRAAADGKADTREEARAPVLASLEGARRVRVQLSHEDARGSREPPRAAPARARAPRLELLVQRGLHLGVEANAPALRVDAQELRRALLPGGTRDLSALLGLGPLDDEGLSHARRVAEFGRKVGDGAVLHTERARRGKRVGASARELLTARAGAQDARARTLRISSYVSSSSIFLRAV